MSLAKRKLDIDHTRERLVTLGLAYAAEQLPALLELEHQGREARRVKAALRLSSRPSGLTLADFDFAFQPAIERSRIDTLATCAFIRAAETLLIQGPPGVGKTHLAGDQALTTAILDRLLHKAHVLNITGEATD